MSERPWERGDHESRWRGYLDPETIDPSKPRVGVLRNRLGIQNASELGNAEDAAVEARRASLDEVEMPGTYGIERLALIHGYVFQDVYEWAGELRTVEIGKGSGYFASVDELPDRLAALATMVEESARLHGLEGQDLARKLAQLYTHVNTTHPFREGNGRTQRVYLDQLVTESGHRVDWSRVSGPVNDEICNQAHYTGNLDRMTRMFYRITSVERPRND